MDIFQTVDFIAGVYALRAVTHLEICSADHFGSFFQNRDADVFSATRIDCGFIYYNCTLLQISAYNLGSTDYRSQIRCMVKIYRCRYCHHNKIRLLQLLFVCGKLHGCLLDLYISHFFCRIQPREVYLYFCVVCIKTDHIQAFLRKCHSNG